MISQIFRTTGKQIRIAAALSAALMALPTAGHAATYYFGSHDGWTTTLVEDPGSQPVCFMHSNMQDGGVFSVIGTSNGVSIGALDNRWSENPGAQIDVEADVNGDSFTGTAVADSNDMITVPVGRQLIRDLIYGDQAVVHLGDNVTWTIDLGGTEDAGYDMERCMNTIGAV